LDERKRKVWVIWLLNEKVPTGGSLKRLDLDKVKLKGEGVAVNVVKWRRLLVYKLEG
jgi:hypothetical protein